MTTSSENSTAPTGGASVQQGPNSLSVTDYTNFGAVGAEVSTATTQVAAAPDLVFKPYQRMPEVSLDDFLLRPVKVSTFTLATDQTAPKVQQSLDPWALWLANPAVQSKLKNQTYIRGELEVEVVCNAAPSVFGCVDISLMATLAPATSTAAIPSPFRTREMTCAHVDLSLSNNVMLEVPWLWPYDYALIASGGPKRAWLVNFTTFHPIQTGIAGGDPAVRLTVFVKLKPGYSLAVTQYQGKGRQESWKDHAVRGAKFLEQRTKGFPRDGPVSSVAATVSSAAGKLKGLPVVGGAAALAELGASAVAGVAAFFGYSRDPVPLSVVGVRTNALDNPAATELEDHGMPAALIGTGLFDPDPAKASGSPEDVMSWASLCSRPTYIGGATISPGAGVGTTVWTAPVTPFWYAVDATNPPTNNQVDLAAVGYCGVPFSYWRGDLIYHVDVMAPTTARGSLQITWQPSETTSGDPTNVANSRVVDIGGFTRFEFKVGYAHSVPFLPVFGMREDTAVIPVGLCNGYLRITVLNPVLMVNPDNLVFVRVWLSGGDNMDFRVPSSQFKTFMVDQSVTGSLQGGIFRYQGGPGPLGGSDSDFVPEQFELVPSSGVYPTDEVNFPGAGVFSARAMIQKATAYQIYRAGDFATAHEATRRRFSPRGPQMWYNAERFWSDVGCMRGFNYAAFYTAPFCGWAGAQHFAWHGWNPVAVAMGPISKSQGDEDFPNYLPPASAANFTGPNGAASFIIPYSSPLRFFPTAGSDADWPEIDRAAIQMNLSAGPAAGITGTTVPSGATAAYSGVLYHSYGPDFRVSQYRQIPRLIFAGPVGDEYAYFGPINAP